MTDASGVLFVLPFPCKLTAEGWVKATTGTALAVSPTRWKLHVETLPGKRAWARRWRKTSTRMMATEPAKSLPQPPVPRAAVASPHSAVLADVSWAHTTKRGFGWKAGRYVISSSVV